MIKKRGRPTLGATPTRPVNITLSQEDIDFASWLGQGNVSAGIRIALEWSREHEAM
jgi:hypothetical protein